MGIFRIPIEIGDPQGRQFERIEALVDTGATYTVIPASVLRNLGVSPEESAPFELADGSIREFQLSETNVRVDGQQVTTLVVFGDDEADALLGAYTLERLRVAADTVRRRLISVPGRLM